MIKLTDKAIAQILEIIEEQKLDIEEAYLRVGVKGGGCSGFSYILDIIKKDTVNEEEEQVFKQKEIKIVCDDKSLLYLKGTEIDFKDEIMGRGFVFSNPNTTSTCGCGSSFSA